MITVVSKNHPLIAELRTELAKHQASIDVIDPESPQLVGHLYRNNVSAVVVNESLGRMPWGAITDLLNGLGNRIPVIVLTTQQQELFFHRERARTRSEFSDIVTVMRDAKVDEILATLISCGAVGSVNPQFWKRTVAFFSPHAAAKMLTENGSIGVLSIDASSFRKIEVEYGNDIYQQVKDAFQTLLSEMWGRPGCFRSSDILCRKSHHGNLYYVFLNRSRTTGSLPLPGILESISDRLARIIENAMLGELNLPAATRRLPSCIERMPKVVVGYGSALHNPCLDPHEVVASAIDASARTAAMQTHRNLDRHRELMTTLIQSNGLLYPVFQGVFRIKPLTKAAVEQALAEKSIAPLAEHIFAFESLIRVRKEELRALMGTSRSAIDPNFLRPDILFETAKSTKVSLELDQTCLNLAIQNGRSLPGYLMINILPRNLYFLKYLQDVFTARGDIILEVSESETIHNVEYLDEVRTQVEAQNVLIAVDDFGRAFASLDRIIQIKPHLIKFDRSLIEDIHLDKVKFAYLDGLVAAARLLGTKLLAEGVEKWEELEVLQKMGIDYVQGFLVHRPQDVAEIHEQLGSDKVKKLIPQNAA